MGVGRGNEALLAALESEGIEVDVLGVPESGELREVLAEIHQRGSK